MIVTMIGSRESPQEILDFVYNIGQKLATTGHIMRSGAAEGFDTVAEKAWLTIPNSQLEIYLPWENFGNRSYNNIYKYIVDEEALRIAYQFHVWLKTHPYEQVLEAYKYGYGKGLPAIAKLMARNTFQILGPKPSMPYLSNMVICYTKCKNNDFYKPEGGTSQALRIAFHYGIKVYNLFFKEDKEELKRICDV